MSCKFCEGKCIPPDGFGTAGIHTMSQNLTYLFGQKVDSEPNDYIRLTWDGSKPFLAFQSSSCEYADAFVEIKYCPMCGKNLKEVKNE